MYIKIWTLMYYIMLWRNKCMDEGGGGQMFRSQGSYVKLLFYSKGMRKYKILRMQCLGMKKKEKKKERKKANVWNEVYACLQLWKNNPKNLKYIKHPWVMEFQVIQMKDNFFLKREIIIQPYHETKLSASEPRRGESFAKIYII